jgi:SAM-dependent methyltransferase
MHRDEEYSSRGFAILRDMQTRHFWYRGRHRFLLHSLRRVVAGGTAGTAPRRTAMDLGGGCGGWMRYLAERFPGPFRELALGDSSLTALQMSAEFLPAAVTRYQVDLMRLHWRERWDIIFLLDVLEHLPDDAGALREVAAALRPGGTVLVTMPALDCFWSYNDEVAHHQRRYDRVGLQRLADRAGLRLVDSRYFMFFLSPLLWLSRRRPGVAALSAAEKARLAERAHQVPAAPLNAVLTAVFAAETPLGHWIPFPWGTSILGVLRKDN